jgi:type I restriction enzyme R subunit
MIEQMRRKLRLLVPLIERSKKNIVYTNFADAIGPGVEIDLPGVGGALESAEFAQFRKKAQHFLKEHLADSAIAKVRSGNPLTQNDIAELQRILVAAGIGDQDTFEEASTKAGNFGKFIRGLVGLDRAAAKQALSDFLDDKRYSKNQLQFVNLIVDELTERGVVDVSRIYEAPYIAIAPEGPETIFVEADLDKLVELLERLANVEVASDR